MQVMPFGIDIYVVPGQLFPTSSTKHTEIYRDGAELNKTWSSCFSKSYVEHTCVISHTETSSPEPDLMLFAWDWEQRLDIKVICAQPELMEDRWVDAGDFQTRARNRWRRKCHASFLSNVTFLPTHSAFSVLAWVYASHGHIHSWPDTTVENRSITSFLSMWYPQNGKLRLITSVPCCIE